MKKKQLSKKIQLGQKSRYKSSKKFQNLKYQRLILKISGEILGSRKEKFNIKSINYIVNQITEANRLGAKIGVVVGGGNLIRGREADWLDKVDADICGMMATIINGVIIHSQLRKYNIPARLSSGLEVCGVVRRCNKFEDLEFYESGGVLIFVGGTGNPLFTTDTAAALRAVEFQADILVKGTKVEGVYSDDPRKNRKAKFYKSLKFDEAIGEKFAIMDLAAFTICKGSKIPIKVYNLMKYPLSKIIKGADIGTLVTNGG